MSSSGGADLSKPADPFQPFAGDTVDVFQCKRAMGDPFSGKDPFAPTSAPSKSLQPAAVVVVDRKSITVINKIDQWEDGGDFKAPAGF